MALRLLLQILVLCLECKAGQHFALDIQSISHVETICFSSTLEAFHDVLESWLTIYQEVVWLLTYVTFSQDTLSCCFVLVHKLHTGLLTRRRKGLFLRRIRTPCSQATIDQLCSCKACPTVLQDLYNVQFLFVYWSYL